MQLIKRTTLLYQAGSSDKVYEVDLCQTSENRYLVNFRYGRRGTNLKEGSKTVQAVPLAEAQRVFDKLVSSQIQKGYRDVTQEPIIDAPQATLQGTIDVPVTLNARHQAILNRLANRDNRKWPLERAIWRTGELKIREAIPLLIPLIATGEPLRDYCIAWALGWCGDESAIPHVRRLSQDKSVADFVRRIAWEALFKLSDEPTRAVMRSEKIEQLPSELRSLAGSGSAEAFATALHTYLNSGDYRQFAVLNTLYQIDNEYVRPALLDILCDTPLKPNYFQRIRHIFKMAEYRHDAEVFGILAYAFDKKPGTFNNKRTGWYYDSLRRRYRRSGQRRYSEELKSPQSNKAYSNQTREYLRRRVWDTLATLGEESDSDYINLAVSVLLQYSDADSQEAKQSTSTRWNQQRRSYDSFSTDWDTYAACLTFNHILYENSPRYVSHPKAWRCREGYKPGDSEPKVREEAFPELWQQNPAALLQLLLESDCRPVHHFAVKAIRDCQQFCNQLDVNTLIKLLNKPYPVTAQLGFELASDRFNPAQPNRELVMAVANCVLHEARAQAYRWIEAGREYFFEFSDFIAGLVTSQQADTRAFARRLLSSSILSDATARVLIGRIIAALLALEPTQTDMAREIGETLLISFTPWLRNLGFGVIFDLLRHPMPEIQELGARILLNHETRAVDLPPELIESLLASPYELVRGIGVRIFGQLPDEKLMGDRMLIVAMAINAVADIRNAIRPVIRRLAKHPDFGTQLISDFIDILLTPERHVGVHSDLVRLMREDIPVWMSGITREKAMQLLRAKSSVAQELGSTLR